MAFAGPDLEADFAKMKGADIDEELGIEQKRNKILNDGTDYRTNCLLIDSSVACPHFECCFLLHLIPTHQFFLTDSYSLPISACHLIEQ